MYGMGTGGGSRVVLERGDGPGDSSTSLTTESPPSHVRKELWIPSLRDSHTGVTFPWVSCYDICVSLVPLRNV